MLAIRWAFMVIGVIAVIISVGGVVVLDNAFSEDADEGKGLNPSDAGVHEFLVFFLLLSNAFSFFDCRRQRDSRVDGNFHRCCLYAVSDLSSCHGFSPPVERR